MKTKEKINSNFKIVTLITALLIMIVVMSLPVQAASKAIKTQTKYANKGSCVVEATMTFDVSNGTVSNARNISVKALKGTVWPQYFNCTSKSATRYSSNTAYKLTFSGTFTTFGESKPVMFNNVVISGYK